MNAPTSLDETIRRAQDILWSALPPGMARTSAVIELKELLWSTQTREALALASDNYVAFALRESRMALADASAWPDKTLSALWTILDDPALNAALGIPHDFCANAATIIRGANGQWGNLSRWPDGNVSAAPAVADHFQPIIVEPAAAETNLSTPGR